ncbi:MAG: aminopeptidase P family protein [Rhodobacteraceae bacterium]|nr:aminopeptidase P family protein [Paracoccaceae bacterium]
MTGAPPRGFPEAEFRARLARAQALMAEEGLAALFLTTEPEIRYFTGYLTRFWESPTRPWFLLVPATGDPVAVIPAIGAHLMGQSWLSDIRTWQSPDYADDGIGLLAETIAELIPAGGHIGTPSGHETHLRMPLADWGRLQNALGSRQMTSDAGILRRLRLVKSQAEIDKIRAACAVADRAFTRVPEIAAPREPLERVFRRFQALCLEEGADWVGYLAGGAGPGGYGDVISPASERPLAEGDVLMLDTGVVRDGYYCDFDRNYAVGAPTPEVETAYARLLAASDAAFDLAAPGRTAAELFHAMDAHLPGGAGGGRLGHGLGMQLTEWPSLIPADETVLEPGMVLTLEPGIELTPGRIMVHEENVVITETGADYLSTPAPRTLPRLGG